MNSTRKNHLTLGLVVAIVGCFISYLAYEKVKEHQINIEKNQIDALFEKKKDKILKKENDYIEQVERDHKIEINKKSLRCEAKLDICTKESSVLAGSRDYINNKEYGKAYTLLIKSEVISRVIDLSSRFLQSRKDRMPSSTEGEHVLKIHTNYDEVKAYAEEKGRELEELEVYYDAGKQVIVKILNDTQKRNLSSVESCEFLNKCVENNLLIRKEVSSKLDNNYSSRFSKDHVFLFLYSIKE